MSAYPSDQIEIDDRWGKLTDFEQNKWVEHAHYLMEHLYVHKQDAYQLARKMFEARCRSDLKK